MFDTQKLAYCDARDKCTSGHFIVLLLGWYCMMLQHLNTSERQS